MQTVPRERIITDWAKRNGFAYFQYGFGPGESKSVTVVMNHAVAHFRDGLLERVRYRNDGTVGDELAREMALVFALCGFMALHEECAAKHPRVSVPTVGDRAASACAAALAGDLVVDTENEIHHDHEQLN